VSTLNTQNCVKCGREITGGLYVNGDGPFCTACQPSTQPQGLSGWRCPNCGQANSPFVLHCPCGPNVHITTTGNTGGES